MNSNDPLRGLSRDPPGFKSNAVNMQFDVREFMEALNALPSHNAKLLKIQEALQQGHWAALRRDRGFVRFSLAHFHANPMSHPRLIRNAGERGEFSLMLRYAQFADADGIAEAFNQIVTHENGIDFIQQLLAQTPKEKVPDFKKLIQKAGENGRFDMVIYLAGHGKEQLYEEALVQIRKHPEGKFDLKLQDLILWAGKAGRIEIMVELAKHGDYQALNSAFSMVKYEDEKYFGTLLRNTKGAPFRPRIYIDVAEWAAMYGDEKQMQIILENLDEEIFSAKILKFRFIDHLINSAYSSLKVNNWAAIITYLGEILDREDVENIPQIIEPISRHSKEALMEYAIHTGNVRLAKSLKHLKLSDVTRREVEYMAKTGFWDGLLQFSTVFPLQIGRAILKTSSEEQRRSLFEYFFELIRELPEKEAFLEYYFCHIAYLGDMKLMQLFFGADQRWKVIELFLPVGRYNPYIKSLMAHYPIPHYWMLVNGILAASKGRKGEMVQFLISKFNNSITHLRILFHVGINENSVFLIKILLRNDHLIGSKYFATLVNQSIEYVTQQIENGDDAFLTLSGVLHFADGIKPNNNYSAGAA